MKFQSSPGGEAGCDAAAGEGRDEREVSILTRRGSRVRHEAGRADMAGLEFQSSPGGEAGCDYWREFSGRWQDWFQSSPGGEAGCDAVCIYVLVRLEKFQSSPGGEAGCDKIAVVVASLRERVSILTRRGSRVRLQPS